MSGWYVSTAVGVSDADATGGLSIGNYENLDFNDFKLPVGGVPAGGGSSPSQITVGGVPAGGSSDLISDSRIGGMSASSAAAGGGLPAASPAWSSSGAGGGLSAAGTAGIQDWNQNNLNQQGNTGGQSAGANLLPEGYIPFDQVVRDMNTRDANINEKLKQDFNLLTRERIEDRKLMELEMSKQR